MEPEINDLLFKFQERLKVLNRSKDTISVYLHYTKEFLKFIQTDDIKKITREHVESYLSSLYDHRYTRGGRVRPYSPASISVHMRSIKQFFAYLEFSNSIFINPADCIKEPKKEKKLPRHILTPEEAGKILDCPNLGDFRGIRDRTMLEVFYTTGIRLNELCCLTIFDVDLKGGFLRINKGKGSKDRVAPLGKHAVRFLREYISKVRVRLTRLNRSTRCLFISYRGNPLDKCMVRVLINTYVKQTGIKKQVTAHTFRHTFATQLIKNGADIRAVQKMMGHSHLSTTREYIKLAGTAMKKDHKKSHPREKDKERMETIKPAIERKRKSGNRKHHK